MVSDSAERLVLGTAQLGMTYGVANVSGQPGHETVNRILDMAWDVGIRALDTAKIYGSAEQAIGEWHLRHPDRRFKVYTKVAPDLDPGDADALTAALFESADLLKVKPSGVFLHDPALAFALQGRVENAIAKAREDGCTDNFGISVYTPEQFAAAISADAIGIIQAPFNVFDTRILDSGLLEQAAAANKEVFFRSIFLQGLITIEPERLPENMSFAAAHIMEWHRLCQDLGRQANPVALKFALQNTGATRLVIGCETIEQLADNIAVLDSPDLPDEANHAIFAMTTAPDRMINPADWP